MDRKCGSYPLRWAGVWAKSVSACHTSGHFYRNFFFRHLRTSQGRSALTVSPRGVKFTLYNPVNFGRKKKPDNWHTAFGFRSSGVFNSKTSVEMNLNTTYGSASNSRCLRSVSGLQSSQCSVLFMLASVTWQERRSCVGNTSAQAGHSFTISLIGAGTQT